MLALAGNVRIFVFRGAVDMRNGFEGLSAFVEGMLLEPITSGAFRVCQSPT